MSSHHEETQENTGLLLNFLSECGLGALLLDEPGLVLAVNRTGEELLEDTGTAAGGLLPELLQPLCDENLSPSFLRISFGRYLQRETVLRPAGLRAGQRIVVFRDATDAFLFKNLLEAANKMNEALIICDEEDCISFCNHSLLEMDSLVEEDILGQDVSDVYDMDGGKECKIPQVRREKKAHLNHRQYYSTKYGKKVTTVSSTFPVLEEGRVISTFNLLEDWSAAGTLQRDNFELQQKIMELQNHGKKIKKAPASARYHFRDIQYNSEIMRTAVEHCEMAAQTDASVMIYGETGTGKELFAQSIHNDSPRAAGPFLAINCAAIPASLLESTLFGSVKGAFTGADDHTGLFEQADGGTLLLDELNSMDISLQAKLLRVLQEGTFRRLGGDREIRVDVRIIANVNTEPMIAIEQGKLRQDLYYRLATVYINIPPLRARGLDVFLLAQNFIIQGNRDLMKNIRDLDPQTRQIFALYKWPGNVRELQHAVIHAMSIIPYESDLITPDYLPRHILQAVYPAGAGTADDLPVYPAADISFRTGTVRMDAGASPAGAMPSFGAAFPAGTMPSGDIALPTESGSYGGASYPAGSGSYGGASYPAGSGSYGSASYPAEAMPSGGAAFPAGVIPSGKADDPSTDKIQDIVGGFEREKVLRALTDSAGNVSRAAAALGISRQSLQYRIRKYAIDPRSLKKKNRTS